MRSRRSYAGEPAGHLQPQARTELDEAATWYEGQRVGLGLIFMAHVDAVIEQIRGRPRLHPVVHGDLRRGLLHRFPYAVIYRVEPTRISILAIVHGRRDPATWQRRAV